MPINWNAIVQCGDTSTNYQLLPGDRVYIFSDPFLRFDTFVAKLLNPWERMFGFTLLGASRSNSCRTWEPRRWPEQALPISKSPCVNRA